MKKYIIFLPILLTIVLGVVIAQNSTKVDFNNRWEKVNELAEKQLPESALKEVGAIQKQAENEKNTVEIIKTLIYKMRFTLEKNPDKAPELLLEFEKYTLKCKRITDRALLYSMTAELYQKYYQSNAWNIDKRTQVNGFLPKDINEWTKNNYTDKIVELLNASLKNDTLLQNTKDIFFLELLNKGDDSKDLKPTLFDFLSNRKIEILSNFINNNESLDLKKEVETTFERLIKFRKNAANIPALIFTELNYIDFEKTNSDDLNSAEVYINALDDLENKYNENEAVVEVLVKKAQYYYQKNNESESDENYNKTAYDICTEGITKFPNYKRISILENIKKQITQKNINISYKQVIKPSKESSIEISSSNISTLELKIFRVNASAEEYYSFSRDYNNNRKLFNKNTLIEAQTIEVKPDENFGSVNSTFTYKLKDYGIYEITVAEKDARKEEFSKAIITVTDLAFMFRKNEPLKTALYVLNRESGHPVSKVKVKIYDNTWSGNGYTLTKSDSVKTNCKGFCSVPETKNYTNNVYFLEKGKDNYLSSNAYAYYNDNKNIEQTNSLLNLFTDRSLYRPGQTVYFKGIAYFSNKNRNEVEKNTSYEVLLYDANNQKISTKTFKTNEFGSFAGEFVLPENGLNGAYRIATEKSSLDIWVEEYKRPTFEVKLEKPKTEIRFGEKVTVTGSVKAFAGFNIGDAKVKYRVVRTNFRYCWWYSEPEIEITNGSTTTDSEGNFNLSFHPKKNMQLNDVWRGQFFSYKIYAEVTDPKGETQQAESMLSVGDKSLFIIANVPERHEMHETFKIPVYAETLNGEKINSEIEYEVYRLEESNSLSPNGNDIDKLKLIEKVLFGKMSSVDKNLELNLLSLKPARYRLALKTNDSRGNEVKTENTFILFDKNGKRPPVKTYSWLLAEKNECKVGKTAIVKFGTSTMSTMVLFEIMQGNNVIESKWIRFCNNIKTFKIPFKESYGAGVKLMFTFMKDETFFTEQVDISRENEEKKLSPVLSVFRDKLLPGEKAEWTISIPETAKLNKQAELMVGMYDASLDFIRPHNWYFNPVYSEQISNSPVWRAKSFTKGSDNINLIIDFEKQPEFVFNELNWFGLQFGFQRNVRPIKIRGFSTVKTTNVEETLTGTVAGVVIEDAPMFMVENDIMVTDAKAVSEVVMKKNDDTKPVQVRTNFNETAFFYPQLRTDSTGNVKFSFTVPESLTRWNVMMLAHTKDLYFGQNEAQVVTQKDLMVQMNLPRFVRRSDKLVLSANVINLTDKELDANIQFEMIDPATGKVIVTKTAPLSLGRGAGGEVVEFEVSEFSSYDLVICKVIARAGNFSDGEQKYLPVLPDKILITESMPMTIRGNETRTFSFESLLKNGSKVETQNLAIEFSTNPAWYAVQSLPTLSAPENENALDYFTAFYANSLAAFIANSNPKIATVFEQWKLAGGSREALLSNLQKNTELKNMLLEETPWVMAAKDETEQKKQIALLFDLNMQKNQSQQYLDKLLKLQTASGGFAWFEGMPESRYITQEILLNLARLSKITDKTVVGSQQLVVTDALNYMDLQISKDFADLKKNNKNYLKENCIGNIQLFYLHTRSEYPEIPINESALEAVKYYTAQSEKYWTSFTLYGKAMMAIVANRNGKTQIANDILKSLKENALKIDEMGMYWAKNTSGYFWNERPVAVQAAIIEAFSEISSSQSDIDEMKIWLLKQKQTQRWDSPLSTVDAIYALLLQGSDWLSNTGKVEIKVGNTVIQTQSTEAGTGYFKETIPVADIRSEMGKVTVSTIEGLTPSHPLNKISLNKSSIGWGAMYWQYYQNLDKVESQSSSLKISKKLFVVRSTTEGVTSSHHLSGGTSMIPIEQTTLLKGDKVITRLVVTTDRNLEFVTLKDLRAACFEPVDQRSGCEWKEGVCYYQTTKDASTQFFFSYLPKGTYVFEYELWANNSGTFTSGIANIQCLYAPEFVSHTGGEVIVVK
ncbi:MAG: alpha-2-macroglobulin family protein [Paludibacter sp.]|nr:alpha-2-macroglobulin family protein [Paludibacter sp.]